MKYILLIALFVIGASTASSQLKVGIVNLEEIGKNMAEAKDAEKIITDLGKKYQDTLQQMQKQLETEFAAYQKQKSMMPQDQQQVKEQDLQAQQEKLCP